jgi:hypothetical protein
MGIWYMTAYNESKRTGIIDKNETVKKKEGICRF